MSCSLQKDWPLTFGSGQLLALIPMNKLPDLLHPAAEEVEEEEVDETYLTMGLIIPLKIKLEYSGSSLSASSVLR